VPNTKAIINIGKRERFNNLIILFVEFGISGLLNRLREFGQKIFRFAVQHRRVRFEKRRIFNARFSSADDSFKTTIRILKLKAFKEHLKSTNGFGLMYYERYNGGKII